MNTRDWTQDLRNVTETARINELPAPFQIWGTWDDEPEVVVVVVTDHDAGCWEHAFDTMPEDVRDTDLSGTVVTRGRIHGGTLVKVALIKDLYDAHVETALQAVTS